jgi:hypothetical protein
VSIEALSRMSTAGTDEGVSEWQQYSVKIQYGIICGKGKYQNTIFKRILSKEQNIYLTDNL